MGRTQRRFQVILKVSKYECGWLTRSAGGCIRRQGTLTRVLFFLLTSSLLSSSILSPSIPCVSCPIKRESSRSRKSTPKLGKSKERARNRTWISPSPSNRYSSNSISLVWNSDFLDLSGSRLKLEICVRVACRLAPLPFSRICLLISFPIFFLDLK